MPQPATKISLAITLLASSEAGFAVLSWFDFVGKACPELVEGVPAPHGQSS
jgi:hypothetical protein